MSHPNIVAMHDYGSLEGEGAYLVMERVHGVTMRAELERLKAMMPAVAAEWFEQLLEGITAAHAAGIIHRDLKPENVMGGRDGSGALAVKILDLGLVKFRTGEPPATVAMTAEGIVMGTPGYMSPEQLLGREVDYRTDIFAMAVFLPLGRCARSLFRCCARVRRWSSRFNPAMNPPMSGRLARNAQLVIGLVSHYGSPSTCTFDCATALSLRQATTSNDEGPPRAFRDSAPERIRGLLDGVDDSGGGEGRGDTWSHLALKMGCGSPPTVLARHAFREELARARESLGVLVPV